MGRPSRATAVAVPSSAASSATLMPSGSRRFTAKTRWPRRSPPLVGLGVGGSQYEDLPQWRDLRHAH